MKTTQLATAILLTALISGCTPTTESKTSDAKPPTSTAPPADQMNDPIKITALAAQKIQEGAPTPNSALRIHITGNQTDGFNYEMNFNTPDRSDDLNMVQHDVKLVVSRSILYLFEGTTIDWEASENGGGFRFSNPKSKN